MHIILDTAKQQICQDQEQRGTARILSGMRQQSSGIHSQMKPEI